MAQTKADEMFISKLNEYVLRHLDNTDLQIDDIADAMNMGRSNFYRKLKGILNMSPNEYLRLFRLKQAASILKEGTYGVVEVSYMVGFSTPPIFQAVLKNSSEYCLKISYRTSNMYFALNFIISGHFLIFYPSCSGNFANILTTKFDV